MIKNEFNIAIVGFGNIGSYFYKTVVKNKKKLNLKLVQLLILNIYLQEN